MEDGTLQEEKVGDRAEGVVGTIGGPLIVPGAVDPAMKPLLVVTITMMADGGRNVEAKSSDGTPVSIGRIREVLRESKEHFDDRVLSLMVRTECERVLATAAKQTGDRNLMARLVHALKH